MGSIWNTSWHFKEKKKMGGEKVMEGNCLDGEKYCIGGCWWGVSITGRLFFLSPTLKGGEVWRWFSYSKIFLKFFIKKGLIWPFKLLLFLLLLGLIYKESSGN